MSDNESAKRQAYIAGLRALAGRLESEPDLPLPSTAAITWEVLSGEDIPARIATIARLLPCELTANDPRNDYFARTYFVLAGKIAGLPVRITAKRADTYADPIPPPLPVLSPLLSDWASS